MAGKINLVSVTQTADGQALATFDYQRDGLQDIRFQQAFPGNAGQAEIGKILIDKCFAIVAAEPVPAVGLVQQMFAGGPRQVPEPTASPPVDQAS